MQLELLEHRGPVVIFRAELKKGTGYIMASWVQSGGVSYLMQQRKTYDLESLDKYPGGEPIQITMPHAKYKLTHVRDYMDEKHKVSIENYIEQKSGSELGEILRSISAIKRSKNRNTIWWKQEMEKIGQELYDKYQDRIIDVDNIEYIEIDEKKIKKS